MFKIHNLGTIYLHKRLSDVDISRGFHFHETPKSSKFRENKILKKIFEFTVTSPHFACWVIFMLLMSAAVFLQHLISKKNLSGTLSECQTVRIKIRMDISVRTDLGPNYLQRLSADDKSSLCTRINTVNTCYIRGCAIVLIIAWFYCMEGEIKRTLSLTGSI